MAPEPPLARPTPIGWLKTRPFAAAACGLGLVALVVATILQMVRDELFTVHPDFRITLPFWLAAAVAAVVSMVRRERAHALAIGGVALATFALALGWVLVLAIVAVVAVLLIHLMSEIF
jgi:hypothetical protein